MPEDPLDDALAGLGVDAAEAARVAAAGGSIAGLVSERTMYPAGRALTARDVEGATGLPAELVRRIWRSAGFPDPGSGAAFGAEDLGAFTAFASALAVFDEEALLHFVRVLGASAERIADAALSMFYGVGQLEPEDPARVGDPERAALAAASFGQAIEALVPIVRQHFVRAGPRWQRSAAGDELGVARLAVAFCDLAGSTTLSQRLHARAYTRALLELEATATEIVVARGGRIVKLVGDGILFVSAVPTAAVDAALALVAAVDAHPVLTSLRAGVTYGEVVPRDGDVFGPVVALASRIVDRAEPGTVLVERAVAERLHRAAGFASTDAGTARLRGFDDEVALAVVHRNMRR